MYKIASAIFIASVVAGCSQSESIGVKDSIEENINSQGVEQNIAQGDNLEATSHEIVNNETVIDVDQINDTSATTTIASSDESLGVTPVQFTERYHSVFEEAGDDGDWYRLDLDDENTQKDFTHDFEGSLSVFGKVNDEGLLESLKYTWNPDEEELQNQTLMNNLIFITSVTAVALTPDADEDDVAYEIGDLLTEVSEKDMANPRRAQRGERQIGNNTHIVDIVDDELTYLIIPTSLATSVQ